MLAALFVSAATFAQQAKPFDVQPIYPTDLSEVTITYDKSQTSLSDCDTVTGVIYTCDGAEWAVADLDLIRDGNLFTAHYTVPEGSVLFACKFFGDDGKSDSGAAMLGSYGMFVYAMSDAGKPVRKQYTWMQRSLIFSKSLDKYAVPGWLREDLKEDDAETLSQLKQELLTFPSSAASMLYYVYSLMDKLGTAADAQEQLRADIDALIKYEATPELELIRMVDLSKQILHDEALAGNIEAVIEKRFPDGLLARDGEMRKVFGEKDYKKQLRMLDEFVKRFPPSKFTVPRTPADEIFYTRLYWTVLRNHDLNRKTLATYLPMMTYSDVVETFYRGIYLPFSKSVKTAAELRPYSELIYNELVRRMNGPEDRFYSHSRNKRFSPRQWHEMTMNHDGEAILVHAQILQQTGSEARALEILEPLKPYMAEKKSSFNNTYAQLLAATGVDPVSFIEESVRHDAATPEMLETLREAYKGDDFDAYIQSLRSDEHVAELEAKLTSQLIKTRVEPFRLEDNRGDMVDMRDLKGKVIVIDFWATWCVPCLAAMPGMKMAVDRYADNPDVVFFFVDTMERAAVDEAFKKQVSEGMAKRGYGDFRILFDGTDNREGQGSIFGTYGRQFDMHGIPQKMIIDGQGNARWVSGGYFGNPLELANEVSFVVDYLLAEK